MKNKAAWHPSCHHKFSNEYLKRTKKSVTKRKLDLSDDALPSPVKTRKKSSKPKEESFDQCIFCDLSGEDYLHKASTMRLDQKVRAYAIELQDTKFLAKLAGSDMIAIDAQYNANCILSSYWGVVS